MTDRWKQEPDFEGDRVVIREAEEAKTQKPGWFSKRAKKASLPHTAASRPPTAASFGSSRRKASSKSQEDELPPRTDATPTPSPSPALTDTGGSPRSPERRSSESTPDVPVHAGFDLVAMRHMIGEAKRHPDQLVVPPSKPDLGTPAPPLSLSSPSAPPSLPPVRQAETLSGAVKPVPYDDRDNGEKSGPNMPDTLSATFITSMTLHDRDPYRTIDKAPVEQREAKLGSESSKVLSQPCYPPEMSPVWTSPSDATLGNPFAGSTEGLSFGSSTRDLTRSAYARNRLGAQSTSATLPGLSFGSPDGTITFQGMEPDPWSSPAEFRNTTGKGKGLGMNPWSM